MKPTTIYFLRSGKSIWTGTPLLKLCQKGWDQAVHASHELSKVQFDAIFTSPLPYAWDTAREVQCRQEGNPEVIQRPELTNNPWDFTGTVMLQLNALMEEIKRKYLEQTVLLVSHGRNADCFLASHIGEPHDCITKYIAPLEHGEWTCKQIIN